MNAHEEEKYTIAHAAIELDKDGKIKEKFVDARRRGDALSVKKR
jgi:DNA-directed RNA polymerase beta subunit